MELKKFEDEEIEHILNYLNNPTKTGLWNLKIYINFEKGFFNDIEKQINNIFDNKNKITFKRWDNKKIKIKNNDNNKEKITETGKKLGFLFALFYYLHSLEKNSLDIFEENEFNNNLKSNYYYLIQKIDLNKLKDTHKDAFNYFIDNIYIDDLNLVLKVNSINRIKNGTYILSEAEKDADSNILFLSLFSTKKKPLNQLKIFLEKVNVVEDSTLIPSFSPEEEIFSPYFSLLSITYKKIVNNKHINVLLEKAIREFSESNYRYCISTIGVITEDYLIQVYETFFRKTVTDKLSLGQIINLTNNSIAQKFNKPMNTKSDFTPIYKKIKDLLKDKEEKNIDIDKEILKTTREIINCIKSDRNYLEEKISCFNNKQNKFTVFPKNILNNINELLSYRNAVSHKTKIPIGEYEALRSMYACITLINWWNKEKKSIDWSKSKDNIIKESVERNTGLRINEE